MSIRLAYSIASAVQDTGLSKTHLTEAIRRGELKARKSSRDEGGEPRGKWVILHGDLEAYLESLPEA